MALDTRQKATNASSTRPATPGWVNTRPRRARRPPARSWSTGGGASPPAGARACAPGSPRPGAGMVGERGSVGASPSGGRRSAAASASEGAIWKFGHAQSGPRTRTRTGLSHRHRVAHSLVSQASRTPTRAVAAALGAVALAAPPRPRRRPRCQAHAQGAGRLGDAAPPGRAARRPRRDHPPGLLLRPDRFNDDGFSGTHPAPDRRRGLRDRRAPGPGEIASIWFTRDRGVVARTGRLRIEIDGRRWWTHLCRPWSTAAWGAVQLPAGGQPRRQLGRRSSRSRCRSAAR